MYARKYRSLMVTVLFFALFPPRTSGGNAEKVIQKASFDLNEGVSIVFLMYPSEDDKKVSSTHRLVLRIPGAPEEVVWETLGAERVQPTATVDINNDWVQVSRVRYEDDSISFLLSTLNGLEIVRMRRTNAKWVQVARGTALLEHERFTSLELIEHGLVHAANRDGDYLVELDSAGKIQRFREFRPANVAAEAKVPVSIETSWIIWTGPSDQTRILRSPTPSAPLPPWSIERAKPPEGGRAVLRIDPDGTITRFDPMVEPPPSPVIRILPRTPGN